VPLEREPSAGSTEQGTLDDVEDRDDSKADNARYRTYQSDERRPEVNERTGYIASRDAAHDPWISIRSKKTMTQ
jgi:hypothetical protein